ncbi:amino acid adenylation domain-containing protein [Streptomyces sp. NBC_00335]|uniref:non-ribosomal peptide synthetase n=1 Tax=unclassified Streptomyces TaxID=2593676 RepID=UPI00225886BB|nr:MULTISPECIES: non-ribosomal peptide synthetase [unclassified Streptomyces]MCX5403585.1 amino acid adenylation domain-containing protein [Streptomyces sp. NBC_00086]
MRRELAPNQVDLYTADRAAEDPATYNVTAVYRITGKLDPVRLAERFELLLDTHPVLAARVLEDGGTWYLETAPNRPRLHRVDLPVERDGAEARLRVHSELTHPLDLATGPLLRATLLTYPAGTADLVLVAHHLVVDAPSLELIARRLLVGEETKPVHTFADWSAAARDRLPGRAGRAAEIRAELAAADTLPSLDWAGEPGGTGAAGGGTAEADVPAHLHDGVRKLASELGIAAHSVFLAAAGFVLGRNSACARPVVGTTVSRRSPAHAATIGYFNNTAAIPVHLDEDSLVTDFLRAVHGRSVQAYRDADLPLSSVLPESGLAAPQLVVSAIAAPPELRDGDLLAVPHRDEGLGTAHFPLTLGLYQEPDRPAGIRMLLRHQRSLVTETAAALFCRQVVSVLAAFTENPGQRLDAVDTLPAAELARLLATGRGEALGEPAAALTELFQRQSRDAAGRTAVVCGNDRLSYRELDDRSRSLAAALIEAGVRVGDRVGVCLDRGVGQVLAVLAVLRAGAAYVPLDPDYPAQRLAFIVEDTAMRTVVTQPGMLADIEGLRSIPVTAEPEDGSRPLPAVGPDTTAYVIYTSGSTGRPKGVLVSHRNVAALLAATRGEYAPGKDDVWSYFHSLAFDFSVWEIWGCLLSGGRLVVVPYDVSRDAEAFHGLLRTEGVTVLNQTPSAFAQLLNTEAFQGGGLAVRLLVFGGEALDRGMLLPWLDRYPADVCRPVNMYGITETTVFCTWHTVDLAEARRGSRSIGRPLPGWDMYVLDGRGRPAPPGVPGEIHVGGAGVTQGYLNRPELNADRFSEDHLKGWPDRRLLYRSGDLGRFLADGSLEYLGRLDDQVKIRGHRIELGEIRHALLEDRRVQAAAALVRTPGGSSTARVDAYVVTEAQGDLADIRQLLAERLPGYLLPATLTAVPELPLTANGKLDAARLPDPQPARSDAAAVAVRAERSGPEAAMAGVWQDVLRVPVDPDDNFFDLGGTSVQAVLLAAALREQGFPDIKVRDVFRNSTPRRLAAVLGSRQDDAQTVRTARSGA